jgi:hypothetical protein
VNTYLVVDIGCIHCGISSNVVGLFETEDQANDVAKKCQDEYGSHATSSFEVFPLPKVGAINSEYVL